MDSLFGVPLSQILIGLLVTVGAIFGVLLFIAWRNPLLVRMGVRNVTRRKTQTVLIVIGLMLSTLIISAAFATGDTVGYSITNAVYQELGETDLVLSHAAQAQPGSTPNGQTALSDTDVEAVRAILKGNPDVDALTGIAQTRAPAINPGSRLSDPQALLVGVDPATVDDLRALVTPGGQLRSASELAPGLAFVTDDLAADILVEAGGTLTLYYGNEPHTLTILAVVRDHAIASQGSGPGGGGGPPTGGGGVIISLDQFRAITGDHDVALIAISATGGVRDTLDLIPGIEERLEAAIREQGLAIEVAVTKAELVAFAEFFGSIFVTFFLVFGLFSMAAGVMLIFLTFVMLAAERRAEMGMARAVGMKRLHLTESFIAEGMTYNLGSALVGTVLGLAVAFGLITALGRIVEGFGLNITFHVNPVGFFISYFLGVVITFVTVAFSSWRAANLNIVRAIRDIPEPEPLRGRDTSISGLLKAMVGALWYLVWILLVTLAGVLVFQAFVVGIAFYGVPVLLVAALLTFFLWGVRSQGRARGPSEERRRTLRVVALVAWWLAFNLVALVAWLLLRTRRWADHHRNSGGWALLMLLTGVGAVWWGGWVAQQAFAYTAGTTLVLLAVAMLGVYFGAPAKPTFSLASAVTLWFWLLPLPFSLFFEDGKGWIDPLDGLLGLVGLGHPPIEGNIEMFFVSGVSITAASTLFVVFNAERLLGALGLMQRLFGGLTPAIRTAISYPLASKFRTGMTLAMFTLVMFSLVVMATLNYNFTQLFLGDTARGGFDVVVEGNPNNRIPDLRAALAEAGESTTGIQAVGALRLAAPQMRPGADPDAAFVRYRLAGLDDEFLTSAAFPLTTRAAGFASDAAVFEAMRNDPTLALANDTILSAVQGQQFGNVGPQLTIQGSIPDFQAAPWEPIPLVVRDPDTGAEETLQIVGFVDGPIANGVVPQWLAIFTSSALVDRTFEGGLVDLFFLQTSTDPREVANTVEAALLERGVQADSLQQRISDTAAQSSAFSTLFEVFMGLGLIVGIAALGVIAFRTVAERRQQIGMLRAIGYSRRLVAASFFLESSFIAVTGVGMGLVLGAALSYNLMTSPEFTGGLEVDFAFPWLRLLVIVAIAYGASALMTIIPARSASRVSVAEALRYNG